MLQAWLGLTHTYTLTLTPTLTLTRALTLTLTRQLFRMRLQHGEAGIPEKLLDPLLTTRLPGFDSCCSIPLGNIVVPFCTPAANLLPHTMAGRDFLLLLHSLDVGYLPTPTLTLTPALTLTLTLT